MNNNHARPRDTPDSDTDTDSADLARSRQNSARPQRSYTDSAVVLRTYPFGEADRVVILMTRNHGKVRAVAKGARKGSSRFAALTQPCAQVEVGLYKGKSSLQTITQVVAVDLFAAVHNDLDRLTTAMAILEAVDYFSLEDETNPTLYNMLAGAIETVATSRSQLILGAFLLRLLCVEGFAPELNCCTSCFSTHDMVSFEVSTGGTRCRNCRQGFTVSENHLRILTLIVEGRVRDCLGLPPSPVLEEINTIAVALFEFHAERRLKALSVTGI